MPALLISMLMEMGPKEVMYSVVRNKVAEGTPFISCGQPMDLHGL